MNCILYGELEVWRLNFEHNDVTSTATHPLPIVLIVLLPPTHCGLSRARGGQDAVVIIISEKNRLHRKPTLKTDHIS